MFASRRIETRGIAKTADRPPATDSVSLGVNADLVLRRTEFDCTEAGNTSSPFLRQVIDTARPGVYHPTQFHGRLRGIHMSGCRRILLPFLLLFVIAGAAGRAAAQNDFEWRVQLKQNTVAPSNIEAENICHRTHSFQVEPESLPFMRLLGPGSFSVAAGASHKVPVEFDTRNQKPGQYEAVIAVKCLSCKSEKGCREDHKNLHVFLTVVPAAPSWSGIHPEQKGTASQSPALRWSNISPEKKPL